ncbi:MAG: hypothetical protein NTW86_02630 [Candidatus Sumerlaeota bacterium]|nr:hypothetical protein [Candidatus Sumerlaeota bacterium]
MPSQRAVRLISSLVVVFVILLFPTAKAGTQETLAAAIAESKVTAAFTGTGASSGDAIRLTVQKTPQAGPGPVVLTIPPGTMLKSSNPSERNMVIAGVRGRKLDAQTFTPQPQITLSDASPITYILGACRKTRRSGKDFLG